MDSNFFITEFKCAVSSTSHYIIKPILLECGHYACSKCVLKEANNHNNIVYCLICDKFNVLNSKSEYESIEANKAIQNNIENLFLSMKNLYKKTIDSFNGKNLNNIAKILYLSYNYLVYLRCFFTTKS